MGIYMKKIATSGQISIFDLFHTYGQTNLGQNTSEDDNADISNIDMRIPIVTNQEC